MIWAVTRKKSRRKNLFARIGGEEFAVLLPDTDTDTEEALHIAERLCGRLRLPVEDGLSISVSIGVAPLREGDSDLDQILCRADLALYCAKEEGRDRVISEK